MSASAQEATPGTVNGTTLEIYLLTIHGTLAAATLEDARTLHNKTAGAPESIAAARSLGDVSHMVYAPTTPPASGAGNVLFLDLWTSAQGLGQFFTNPQVQEQAGQLFTDREPVVWEPADGFYGYHIPAPYGQNDRIVALVRGSVAAREDAKKVHNEIVASHINAARLAGVMSHDAYFRLAAPGEAETLEFLAMDVWKDATGLQDYYAQADLQSAFQGMFATPPTVETWVHAAGDWAEW
jgi:hypothetical protein